MYFSIEFSIHITSMSKRYFTEFMRHLLQISLKLNSNFRFLASLLKFEKNIPLRIDYSGNLIESVHCPYNGNLILKSVRCNRYAL